MIVEKPAWLRHEGLQMFSIDIQPGGRRCATAGGDYKVRIWDMKYLSNTDCEPEPNASKLLATLRDHFGSVNCVRWSRQRQLIASGSDDQIVLIHERRPGTGTTEFGSGEPPDVENWKVLMTLRGHTADVVDLGWCSDDSLLATCSLDNTVRIWNMSNGSHVAVLTGHSSLVKGVAWDPVGSFLASQSDDKSVIIWRTSDWSLAQKIEGHWDKTVGSTFFRRLDWSPCGHFITTTNGFQKPRHSAPVLERGDWTASYDFLGHNAPIVAVRFNHSLFRKQPHVTSSDAENGKEQSSIPNGNTKSCSKDAVPYNVIAMGSQDCSITVWTTTSARPVFVGKHFFTQSVVDLTWSPDGYSLFCCSLDGSVAAFHFEVKELGYKFTDSEMEDLKKSRYGDTRGRQTTLAESPAQLMLESLAAKQWGSNEAPANNAARLEPQPAISTPAPVKPQVPVPVAIPASSDAAAVQVTNTGTVTTPAPPKETQPRALSPVKQREYRRPDGRRRIIPEPVGPQVSDDRMLTNGLNSAPSAVSGKKRDADTLSSVDTSAMKDSRKDSIPIGGNNATVANNQIGLTGRANFATNCHVMEARLCPIDAAEIGLGLSSAQREVVVNADIHNSKGILSITVLNKDDPDDNLPICLEAKPPAGAMSSFNKMDTQETEIICTRGGQVQWQDRLAARSTAIAGNLNMWAVGCDDGTLQIYTKAGRRALPSMMVGSAPVFLDCNEGSNLLLLTRNGTLYMWDCMGLKCLLKESVLPLLSMTSDSPEKGAMKVVSARISKSGSPLVILANQHAFVFHMDMKCWQRVMDDQFHASSFFTSLHGMGSSGDSELASLQTAAANASLRNHKWNRVMKEDKNTTRSHLESRMASAVALKSRTDYQHFLLAYVRFLAREADEVRLRELCMDFLGGPCAAEAGLDENTNTPKWQPDVLGLKKHDLLKAQVLPAMASNRSVQRLLNEIMDLLSEQEGHSS